ncbi:MAG: choice-of-anchor B family protein [Saprospiraceae bacterium]|nr:choice-of-anchor B family protein [Saprospiraceae bacterium]
MNKLSCLLALFIFPFLADAQSNLKLELLGHWDDDSLPIASPNVLKLQYNSCWGLAVQGREYAVVGGAAHVLFFDVTDPCKPALRGKFAGRSTVVPREFKSYKNRVYAVADGGTSNDGLMIFDLSNARDTIVRTYWDTTFFKKIHTIALDTVSGRIYLNGGNAGNGIIVLDASKNPDSPEFMAHPIIPGEYVHDCYVRNDTVYASSGNEGYYVFDFKDPANPKQLAYVSTGGYNHNSWLTLDGKYAYYTEEIPSGLPIKIVDLQNLSIGEIEIAGNFLDNLQEPWNSERKAIPHNLYIKDDLLFVSQYEDGLLVYDIRDRLQPVLIDHYDTHPQNTTYNGYFGNWGNYPWLPSGTIVTSDMQNGLFLFKLWKGLDDDDTSVYVFPNPAHDYAFIRTQIQEKWSWRVFDAAGKLMMEGAESTRETICLDLSTFQSGAYMVEVKSASGARSVKKLLRV